MELTSLPIQLRIARESAGLSQRELAISSGVGEKTISSFETGLRIDSIKVAQLGQIADACHVTIAELLTPPLAEVKPHSKRESRTVMPPKFKPNRGITIFRSSDFLQSSLGDHQR